MHRRNSQQIIDYLRTHQAFEYWAPQVVKSEEKIRETGVDDWLSVNLEKSAYQLLMDHFEREGLDLKCTFDEYLLETGFSNPTELSVALERIAASKED
jgi:hypothetical protein